MTPPPDELGQLWKLDPGTSPPGTSELLREIEQTAARFDRTVWFRDLRESVAGVLVTLIFGWLAFHDPTWLESAAHAWLAGCGLWIVFYIRRRSVVTRNPVPEQSLLHYQQQLLNRYDQQIGLLKSAKYWYILPLWVGLLFSSAAIFARTRNVSAFVKVTVLVTVVNGIVWWLNERVAVGRLQEKRRQLMARTGIEGETE